MAAPTLRVVLRGAAGEVLELDLDGGATVSDVKREVASRWRVPALCQALTIGGSALEDDRRLASYEPGEGGLEVAVAVSLSGAGQELDSAEPPRQVAALEALATLGPRAGEVAVILVSAQLRDADLGVRCAAVKALIEVAESGDPRARAALADHLDGMDAEPRSLALDALSKLGKLERRDRDSDIENMDADDLADLLFEGSPPPGPSAGQTWDSPGADPLSMSIEALAEEVEGGSLAPSPMQSRRNSIASPMQSRRNSIASNLAGSRPSSREAGLMAARGQTPVRRGSRGLMGNLRRQASSESRPRTADSLLGFLDTRLESVAASRRGSKTNPAAVPGQIAEEIADDLALRKVDEFLGPAPDGLDIPDDAEVECLAIQTLAAVTHKGDQDAIDQMKARLEFQDARVRAAAVKALGAISERGDDGVVASVRACLEDQDPQVRLASVLALSHVAPHGDESTMVLVLAWLADAGEDGERAAVLLGALANVSKRGDERTQTAVLERVDHSDYRLRLAATQSMDEAFERGDERAVVASLDRATDLNAGVRYASIQSMRDVAHFDDQRVFEALNELLKDEEPWIYWAAVRALEWAQPEKQHSK